MLSYKPYEVNTTECNSNGRDCVEPDKFLMTLEKLFTIDVVVILGAAFTGCLIIVTLPFASTQVGLAFISYNCSFCSKLNILIL